MVHALASAATVFLTRCESGLQEELQMERIILGESGLSVSPVALGTWQLSPRFWGDQSKDDAIAAVRLAFERGVNFIEIGRAHV